jgi:hypothetical protein
LRLITTDANELAPTKSEVPLTSDIAGSGVNDAIDPHCHFGMPIFAAQKSWVEGAALNRWLIERPGPHEVDAK